MIDEKNAIAGKISAVIPSYNGRAVLEQALRDLSEHMPEVEVIVVDGGSTDGSRELTERDFPRVKLLCIENHGWSYANNRGLEEAAGEFVLFMNSDVYIKRDSVLALAQRLIDNKRVGCVAPRLLNTDSSVQHVFGFWYGPNWRAINAPTKVRFVPGACFMMRREDIISVGAFDENFFFYNEEFDLSHRLRDAGLTCEILPMACGERINPTQIGIPHRGIARIRVYGVQTLQRARLEHHSVWYCNCVLSLGRYSGVAAKNENSGRNPPWL